MDSLSKIPNGMRYYFGAEARLRRAVEDEVMSVFDGWGYEEIAAPTVDYYALFERGMGRGEAHRAFRFTDTDGRMLARARPLRFCYAASVFRQQPRSRAEWRRQSRQVGCELLGVARLGAEMEVLLIAAEVLDRLGLRADARVTLSHAGLFNGVAAALGLEDEARERMRQLIDTRDAAELERFLSARAPSSGALELATRLARLSGKREALAEAKRAASAIRTDGAAGVRAALGALEKLWDMLAGLGLADNFDIDLADVSGLDYYTGLVFRVYVAGAGARVGSGGRYDDLAANFGASEPAIGFVLELDALAEVLARREAFRRRNGEQPHAVVEGAAETETFREALRRRAAGERVRLGAGGEEC
jgi:ATP phosphoribosyltransferase regulatory subunit